MRVTIHIPTALRKLTSGALTIELDVKSLADLLDQMCAEFPDISRHLRDDRGELRRFLNIYVNEEDIRFLGGGEYKFKDGDVVLLVPSIAGGSADEAQTVAASAPASSANLGCAFDCAALALDLRLRARATIREERGIVVTYRGLNAERVPNDASNLVAQGMLRYAAARGAEIPGAEVNIENEIPVGVGLGSSAAATVCGLLLGASILGVRVDREEILALAAKAEGHPDNAAAACLGGLVFTAAVPETGRVLHARTELPESLRVLAIVPPTFTSTRESRAALPREYSRADAVQNLQRASLLAALCFSGSDALVPELFRDRLHQPYRAPRVPGLAECLAVEHADLLGVCLSGSGPAALAIVRGGENEFEIARLLTAPFAEHGAPATVLMLRTDTEGARIEPAIVAATAARAGAGAATEGRRCRS